eukprot:6091671-Heterocapsa_arctica.AAC.1
MDTEREIQRGLMRLRDEDEAEEASQELQGRLRSSMVGAVETEGPPWHDRRTGALLSSELVKQGMD